MSVHEVFSFGHGLGAIGHAELQPDDLDTRKTLLYFTLKSIFAFHSGCATWHESDDSGFAPAAQNLTQAPGRHTAAFDIVGSDIREDVLSVDGGVEDGNRNSLTPRAFDHAHQRASIHGREHNSRQPPVDHGLDNLNLAARIDFERWRIPFDFEMIFTPGFDGARVNRLPKNMICAFRNHTYHTH